MRFQENASVIFDGTSRLGEVFVIVIRFVDSGWLVHQRLIRVKLLANSLSGEEIAREIINSLSLEYGVGSEHVLAVMHDCASTNVVAMRTLKVLYPLAQGIGCFSHTLDRAGERFSTPIAHEFVTYWISLFAHSPKARLLWSQQQAELFRDTLPLVGGVSGKCSISCLNYLEMSSLF